MRRRQCIRSVWFCDGWLKFWLAQDSRDDRLFDLHNISGAYLLAADRWVTNAAELLAILAAVGTSVKNAKIIGLFAVLRAEKIFHLSRGVPP